jgi:lysophospholipase L1-like esterase
MTGVVQSLDLREGAPMRWHLFWAAALFLPGALLAQDGPRTTQPAPKDPKRHEAFLQIAQRGGVDLLFLGDSITDGWRKEAGKAVWDEHFAPLRAANFGIGGDRTEHVLWRVMNGELTGLSPKAIVLLIGTNNGKDSADDVAQGIAAIVREIQARSPSSKILLLGIFPRGEVPNLAREKNDRVNAIIPKLDDARTVRFLDIGARFLREDKSISREIMPDALHLSEKGYRVWAEAILPTVKELLAQK